MAVGDDAAAAGMPLVPQTGKVKDGATEINRTRDLVAKERAARIASDGAKVDKPGDGAGMARREPGSAHSIGFYTDNNATVYFRPEPSTGQYDYRLAKYSEIPAPQPPPDLTGYATTAQIDGVYRGDLSPQIYNRQLAGQYRVAYVGADGRLGWVSSSRRHKKNIRQAAVDVDAVLAMQLVTFLYKVDIDTDREGIVHHGLIAEQLDELGLEWLVDYGEGGTPEGVRYDRIALALLPAIQDAHTRIADLATRIAALEADVT